MNKITKAQRNGNGVISFVSVLTAVIFLVPLLWALVCSFKVEGSRIASPMDWFEPPFTLKNYYDILFNSKVALWLTNSILIAVFSVMLTVAVTSLAAYPFAKLEFTGKKLLYLYFIIGLVVPGEATIVPLFIVANQLNILDSYAGLLLPSLAGSMNFMIAVAFFRGIPKDMMEAARIDGAGDFRIFWCMIIPLSKTILVTISIFSFMGSWNNYLWPLLCAINEKMFTLPVGIPTFAMTYSVDYVKPMTANVVASVPAIILYLIFEKHISQGVSLSGIKG
jgi:multiple sugar transport system permease protein